MNRNRTTDSYVKFNENGNIFHRHRVESEREKKCVVLFQKRSRKLIMKMVKICAVWEAAKNDFVFNSRGINDAVVLKALILTFFAPIFASLSGKSSTLCDIL